MFADTASLETPGRFVTTLQKNTPAILCTAFGFLSAFTISIGGQMPVGELLLLIVFPWVLTKTFFSRGWPTRGLQLGWFQLLMVLAILTAVGYVVSDLYRGSPSANLIRGWARVGFLFIDLVTIVYLVDMSWQRLQLCVFGLYAGRVLDTLISGPLHGEWWKFGVGYGITILILFAIAGRGVTTQIVVAVALGILNIVLGARSLGGTCLVIAWLFGIHNARGLWRPVTILGGLTTIVGMLVAANIFIIEQQNRAGSDMERQSMLETAVESFVTSPIIGRGSWFTATGYLGQLEQKRSARDASFTHYEAEEAAKISIHSQLLVSLAEGGILGGMFFLGLGGLIFKTIRTLTRHSVPHRAFVLYLVLAGGWNLLMTPFSGVTRVEIGQLVAACLLVIMQRQGELSEDYRE